jgi:hypothetical protein
MIAPAQGLAERRQELVARSAAQRSSLIADAESLLGKAAALDRIVGAVRRHSVVVGAVAGVVALLGSRKLLDLATRLVTLYMLVRRR